MENSHVLLARQPIYNKAKEILAYELLFRAGSASSATFDNPDQATSEVILNAFTSLPVEDLLEGRPAFINFTRRLLDEPPPIDKTRVVVEVLESVELDASAVAAIRKLKQAGYTIALDDYSFDPDHAELLELVDIVKVDVMQHGLDNLAAQVALLKPFALTLLAEKVETHEMFNACVELGFEQFQGYFLARPQLVSGRRVSSSQQSILQLFAMLENPDVEIRQIEQVIASDPVLSYKLLRLINSAYFNLEREIDSIHRAITLLGLARIKSLAALMSLGKMENKPRALHLNTLIRAQMCRLLGEKLGEALTVQESLFTVGLLSALDAYLDMDLADILTQINLTEELKEAILLFKGRFGFVLATSITFERCQFEQLHLDRLDAIGLTLEQVEDTYIAAVKWAGENLQLMF